MKNSSFTFIILKVKWKFKNVSTLIMGLELINHTFLCFIYSRFNWLRKKLVTNDN